MKINFLYLFFLAIIVSNTLTASQINQVTFAAWNKPDVELLFVTPKLINQDTEVLFIIHGSSRDARGYLELWLEKSKNMNVILIAPHFTKIHFPYYSTLGMATHSGKIIEDDNKLLNNSLSNFYSYFKNKYKLNVKIINASRVYFKKLNNVIDPEKKRKIIGNLFIKLFEKEAKSFKNVKFLAQGTLYPDIIESRSATGSKTSKIKSHHNVGGLPERMNMQLVEPLRELFKDEVRDLGRELGLPDAFIGRHPFPGPGLAIRIPGDITQEKADILRKADFVYLDEIKKAGLYDEIWQAFAVLLPVRSVGVMGDARTYDYVLALRAVTSTDGMTADYYPFEHDFLGRVPTRIINEVRGVNRVVYDITSKPPGTIEWE